MKPKKNQKTFSGFLNINKQNPILAAIAAGLYPILFYYTNNFTFINTWKHLGFFIVLFLFFPVVVFWLAYRLTRHKRFLKVNERILPFLNILAFLIFIQLCIYAKVYLFITLSIVIIAGIFAWFWQNHFQKIMVFQFLLAVLGVFYLVPVIVQQLSYSKEWIVQPDDIEQVVFKKRPNVYYIEPDGYTNFSELDRGYYNVDDSEFKNFLQENGFKLYPNFRSNYSSTLVSNSATFMMKHHYYNNGFNFNESLDAREIIITKNAVLDAFKKNGYKTHYFAEWSYILANRPQMGYDVCNFDYGDISYLNSGFKEKHEVIPPLKKYITEDPNVPKFFFVEIFSPGHVPAHKNESEGVIKEKEKWVERLQESNKKLTEIINFINEKDPTALILIMADHGGYVGLEYMLETNIKTQERDKLYSALSSNLAIKWPNGEAPIFDSKLKTPVNTFRILFSYLSDNKEYLNHLQEDASYLIINEGAPKGVYKCIDANGEITFEKH